jgi:hypothetical protein
MYTGSDFAKMGIDRVVKNLKAESGAATESQGTNLP